MRASTLVTLLALIPSIAAAQASAGFEGRTRITAEASADLRGDPTDEVKETDEVKDADERAVRGEQAVAELSAEGRADAQATLARIEGSTDAIVHSTLAGPEIGAGTASWVGADASLASPVGAMVSTSGAVGGVIGR